MQCVMHRLMLLQVDIDCIGYVLMWLTMDILLMVASAVNSCHDVSITDVRAFAELLITKPIKCRISCY